MEVGAIGQCAHNGQVIAAEGNGAGLPLARELGEFGEERARAVRRVVSLVVGSMLSRNPVLTRVIWPRRRWPFLN